MTCARWPSRASNEPALATLACPSRTLLAACLTLFMRRRGYDDLSLTGGGSQILTPTLQRLATEGIVMSNYYVNPICTPTRTRCACCRAVRPTGWPEFSSHQSVSAPYV